jgi:hypothetical protein
MLEDGSLANLQLKGSAVQGWGEFTQKGKQRLVDEWVSVDKAIDGKKGAVKFTTPDFKFLQSITDVESELADDCFNTLEAYLTTYLSKAEPVVAESIDDEAPEDDLDF